MFNNDRTALIAVQGAFQDPASRMTTLPVAQAQDLSMTQAAQSLEQSAQRQQVQQQEPTQSAVQSAQAQSGLSPRAASL